MADCGAAEGGMSADPALTSMEKYDRRERKAGCSLNLYEEYEKYFADPKYKNKSSKTSQFGKKNLQIKCLKLATVPEQQIALTDRKS